MKGFSLLEVMVALGIFGITMAYMGESLSRQVIASKDSDARAAAAMAVQQYFDEVRSADPSTLPGSGSGTPVRFTIGGNSLTLTPSFCENITYCSTANVRHIVARVTKNGREIFEAETIFTQLR